MNRDVDMDVEWQLAFEGQINDAVLQEYGRGYFADIPDDSPLVAACHWEGQWPNLESPRQQVLSAAKA